MINVNYFIFVRIACVTYKFIFLFQPHFVYLFFFLKGVEMFPEVVFLLHISYILFYQSNFSLIGYTYGTVQLSV